MNTILLSTLIGMFFGLIDIIPMIIKKLEKLFIISAFLQWTIIGFLFNFIDLPITGIIKGLFLSLLFMSPSLPLIYKVDKPALPVVLGTSIVLGSLLGIVSNLLIG